VGIINLYSLSHSEIAGTLFDEYSTSFDELQNRMRAATPLSKQETFAKIPKGGMPRLYENFPATNYDYFSAYFQTYLSRDIKDLAQVADELSFYKFIQVCSSLAAKQVSYTEISKRVGITANKAKQWVSILVSSGIVALLQPYFSNALKRVVKTSKMYFMDTGLLCYLRGIESAETLERSADSGDIFENYVVSEIYKSFVCVGKNPPLYYYRDANNRKEIDLLIERDGIVYPIEIKESSNPDGKAAKWFDAISPLGNVGTGNIICNSKDMYPVTQGIWAVPHWCV
jgi:predicted AAA+ superfamily ATPase